MRFIFYVLCALATFYTINAEPECSANTCDACLGGGALGCNWNGTGCFASAAVAIADDPEETAVAGFDAQKDWWKLLVSIVLILFSALFSGLTLGLMGLDVNGLEIVINGGDAISAAYAAKIAPVRRNGNLLLCTLLMGNVAVNAALSIVMADMTSGLVGFLSSTFGIVIFGEIIPQALCSRHPLSIGAHTLWLVKIIMYLLIVLTYPMSKALDVLLGAEMGTVYNKNELKQLVNQHKANKGLADPEARIMVGALDFSDKQVKHLMTPFDKVFTLELSRNLDFNVLTEIFKSGYSRIPIVDKKLKHDNVVGLLLVKDLILIDPSDEIPISTLLSFYGRNCQKVFPDSTLSEVLDLFKSGKGHMAVVREVDNEGPGDPFYVNAGIVTLEDIIETILQADIKDETERGDMQFSADQLRFFDSRRFLPTQMTPQETSAVYFHLVNTVQAFSPEKGHLSQAGMKKIIAESPVHVVKMPSDGEGADGPWPPTNLTTEDAIENGGLYLYKMGMDSDYFSLVLDGALSIRAGRNGFKSESGRWTVLCANVLDLSEHEFQNRDDPVGAVLDGFVPDFSAKVCENARILRISRSAYKQMVQEEMDALQEEDRQLNEFRVENAAEEIKEEDNGARSRKESWTIDGEETSIIGRSESMSDPRRRRPDFQRRASKNRLIATDDKRRSPAGSDRVPPGGLSVKPPINENAVSL